MITMEDTPNEFTLTLPLIDEENYTPGQKLENNIESNYSHQSASTTSTFKTIFNGLNALSGIGILSIPYALASGGWLSLILLVLIAMAAFYSGLLIKKCMDSDSNIRTYPDIGEVAFGNNGRMLVSILMYIELYLVATGFLILEGDNLQNLSPHMEFNIGGLVIAGRQCFVVIVSVIILPTVWLESLSLLSYVSATGVIASVIILASVVWTGAFDGIGFNGNGTLLNWHGIPTAVSLFSFCYCAHPVFPTLYTSMKNKRQFSNVLLICFVLSTFSYASMAIVGYMMFGPQTKSQITLNLPSNTFSSRLAIYTTLVNPISKYALMVTPIINTAKNHFPSWFKKRHSKHIFSTALVISTVIVAIAVPFFGSLMSLVGAFLSVTVSITLPCLCYLKISGVYERFGLQVLTIMCIVILGVLVAVFGTYTSLMEIIGHL